MSDEKDEEVVELASVDLFWGQWLPGKRPELKRYLHANVLFDTPEIEYKNTVVKIAAHHAHLRVHLRNCKMTGKDANYQNQANEAHEKKYKRETALQGSLEGSTKIDGIFGTKGISGNAVAEAEAKAKAGGVVSVHDEWHSNNYITNLTLCAPKEPRWKLKDPTPGASHLEGCIIGENDRHGGCLGLVTLNDNKHASLEPDIELTLQSIIVVDNSELGLVDKAILKRKSAVLTAIMNKKLRNTPQEILTYDPSPRLELIDTGKEDM